MVARYSVAWPGLSSRRLGVGFVHSRKSKDATSIGTAFAVSPNAFVTARHVVTVKKGARAGQFRDDLRLTLLRDGRTVDFDVEACGPELVVLLLRTSVLPSDTTLFKISRTAPLVGAPWVTIGFPARSVVHDAIGGRVHIVFRSSEGVQLWLHCFEAAASKSIHGFSGAPVIIGQVNRHWLFAGAIVKARRDLDDPEFAEPGGVILGSVPTWLPVPSGSGRRVAVALISDALEARLRDLAHRILDKEGFDNLLRARRRSLVSKPAITEDLFLEEHGRSND